MNIDKDRLYNSYYLNVWDDKSFENPCMRCELNDMCDRVADELNQIEYCMCMSKGVIKDTNYKKTYPLAYFKNIKDIIKT